MTGAEMGSTRACQICNAPHHARGWCQRHYDQILHHGRTLTEEEAKSRQARNFRDPEAQARANDAKRARIDARIEDLEFLIDAGTNLEVALARIGWTPAAASRALYRRDHPLAREATRLASLRRRKAA